MILAERRYTVRAVERGPHRVAILTADVGEGHLAAARVLAEEIRRAAPEVEVVLVDALEALGPVLRLLLLDAYWFQLRRVPRAFQTLFWLFLHVGPLRALGRASLVVLGGRRFHTRLEALAPDVIVSTYPAATSVLGTLRRRGKVTAPALATITDFAGVQFWSHPGIDLHLVMHPSLIQPVEKEAGPDSACTVAPLVARAFKEVAGNRDDARKRLNLPLSERVVVVSGGGWGVGDVEGAVAEAASLPATTVVAVTGRNGVLHARLRAAHVESDRVRVLGFTDRMPDLLAATDVLVHTTGGVTSLEALTVGCPLVAYGPPAGHAPTLARTMDEQKVARYARSRRELREAILSPLPAERLAETRSAVDCLLTAQLRVAAPRRVSLRFAYAAVTVAIFAGVLAASRTAFAVIARPLNLSPQTVLPTRRNEVALVIDVPPALVPQVVRRLAGGHARASFATPRPPSQAFERLLAAHHDQTISLLSGPGIDDWIGTMDAVRDGLGHGFALAPAGGISTGQYVLAAIDGDHLIAAAQEVERGAVVVWTGGSLERLLSTIAAQGLRAAPAATLGPA